MKREATRCREPERRSTRQLEAIYREICLRDDHPSAEQVYARVRTDLPSTSRGTVYRNLQKLVQEERIRVVPVAGRAARYDARLDPHDHFVCRVCGSVLDVHRKTCGRPRQPPTVAGHRVETSTITYFGRCRGCRNGATAGRSEAP